MNVEVHAPVKPSEDPAKVRKALRHIFPDATVEATPHALVARSDNLDHLASLIRRQKILDAARKTFLRGLDPSGRRARFRINKQAALAGRVSFSGDLEAPLGDFDVDVQDPNLDALLRTMAPMTIRGIPVSEDEAERVVAKRRTAKKAAPPKPVGKDEELDQDDEDLINNEEEETEEDDEE